MQTKIRVLHIAQAAGGVDRYLRSLLKYFDREKFENILLCSYDFKKDDYDEITDDFIQINMQREISAKHDLSSVRQVRKVIKSLKPDVVYMHSSKAGAIGRIATFPTASAISFESFGEEVVTLASNISVFSSLLKETISLSCLAVYLLFICSESSV